MIPVPNGYFGWWCPGCETVHWVPIAQGHGENPWGFERDAAGRPTLSPSVLTYPRQKFKNDDAPLAQREIITTPRCHLFIKAGQIEFLADCTHSFAGKTVPCEERTELDP